MKELLKKTAIMYSFLALTTNLTNAQNPFGTPPGGNLQSATYDHYVSDILNTNYVAALSGGPTNHQYNSTSYATATCIGRNANRTGNDIQSIDTNFPFYTTEAYARAIVWDGDCPSFSLVITTDPFSSINSSASFIVELEGNHAGTIKDPDIIISQNHVSTNEIAILIVYELEISSTTYVAFEQWNYNFITKTISQASNNTSKIISKLNGVNTAASNPNIDGNKEDDLAIVFEMNGLIYSYIGNITSASYFNLMPIFNLGSTGTYLTPDVSVSNGHTNSMVNYLPVVHYIYTGTSGQLFLTQERYINIFNSLQSSGTVSFPFPITVSSNAVENPRIATPPGPLTKEKEFAATASYNPTGTTNNEIILYHNAYSPIQQYSLNNAGTSNPLYSCKNEFPAIAYTDDNYVTVAWTFDLAQCGYPLGSNPSFGNWDRFNPGTPGRGGAGTGTTEIVAVSAKLSASSINRIPAHPDYFMLASSGIFGDQSAVSIADLWKEPSPKHEFFYSFATTNYFSGTGSVDDIIFKVSTAYKQPQLRKKYDILEEKKNPFSFYPNPTSNELNLDLSSLDQESTVSIRLISLDGKTILEQSGRAGSFSKIDVEPFAKGLYYIEFNVDDELYQEKLIIH